VLADERVTQYVVVAATRATIAVMARTEIRR
jgi:hypothetical protein